MITITQGDITDPIWKETNQIIIHVVNDIGAMGAGVALALLKKWPKVREEYINLHTYYPDRFKLGQAQFVSVEPTIEVVNLIGQRGIGWTNFKSLNIKIPPIRYEALYEGFLHIRDVVKKRYIPGEKWTEYTFHLPMLGSGLAGGQFEKVFETFLHAFKGTNSRSCFYAFSDEDYDVLQKNYTKYCSLPDFDI